MGSRREVGRIEILEALWEALRNYYPMMEYVGAWDDEWLDEFRPLARDAQTDEEAYWLMDELVCRLNDYHTMFFWPCRQGRANGMESPPVRADVAWDGDRAAVVIVEAAPGLSVQPGDEILAVDGVPIDMALAEALKHSVGSTPSAKNRAACWRMLLGPRDQPAPLIVRSSSSEAGREVSLPRDSHFPDRRVVSDREVDGTPVIRITQWGDRPQEKVVPEFDLLLDRYRMTPRLVIDVRGNGGGLDAMAEAVTGRFLKSRVISSISFYRVVPSLSYERTIEWTRPRGPWRYEGRVAVLIDEGSKSACEHFVSGMLEAGAFLAGAPTDGSCGLSRHVQLPGGAHVSISRSFPLHGKDPSALHGIRPHVHTPYELADLREGRDPALEAALDWLKSNKSLPNHPQRLSAC